MTNPLHLSGSLFFFNNKPGYNNNNINNNYNNNNNNNNVVLINQRFDYNFFYCMQRFILTELEPSDHA